MRSLSKEETRLCYNRVALGNLWRAPYFSTTLDRNNVTVARESGCRRGRGSLPWKLDARQGPGSAGRAPLEYDIQNTIAKGVFRPSGTYSFFKTDFGFPAFYTFSTSFRSLLQTQHIFIQYQTLRLEGVVDG
ncbi:hypothetical protein PGT21_027615 [Puccinia graminis f. sp. tritici]|uniref:Uncharacterized protein n=1 Tax=Puccinia graminis f. sp. tritici TaxID=56615 RepID=A0A5B0R3K3_PUCGR|nr:hypothetical protein PGT21_027615 [Puccinia graminis f. sp. tritici]